MELLEKIHAKIQQNGFITFDEYMDMSLYFPKYGYYNSERTDFHPKNSDFITAPELSAIYTNSIVKFYTDSRKHKKIENVLEFGAGSGEMAYNFLKKCNSKDLPTNYFIIEKNANLIKKQKNKLQKLPKNLFEKINWVDNSYVSENVFIIANEILDAIPSKIFYKEDNKFYEKCIIEEEGNLAFSLKDCNGNYLKEIHSIEDRLNRKLPNSYTFEINMRIESFLLNIFKNSKNFLLMIIDYGYHEDEFFHPQRKNGTVQFYKNHKKINDIFSFQQGSFDISISVNFSNIYRIAKRNSIELYSFTTQSEFLLNMNILELAKEIEGNSERNNILKTLLFPTDMGENFKFMFLSDFIIKDFKSSFKDYRHKL